MICRKFELDPNSLEDLVESNIVEEEEVKGLNKKGKRELVEYLLYGVQLEEVWIL